MRAIRYYLSAILQDWSLQLIPDEEVQFIMTKAVLSGLKELPDD